MQWPRSIQHAPELLPFLLLRSPTLQHLSPRVYAWPRPCICPVGPILLPSGLSPHSGWFRSREWCLSGAERGRELPRPPGLSTPAKSPHYLVLGVQCFLMLGCKVFLAAEYPPVVAGDCSSLQCWGCSLWCLLAAEHRL